MRKLFFLIFITLNCCISEKEFDYSNVLSIESKHDTINSTDSMELNIIIGDTTLMDLSQDSPQFRTYISSYKNKPNFREFNLMHKYLQIHEFEKDVEGDELISDTVYIDFRFKTNLQKDTVIQFYKIYFASNNHSNLVGEGQIIEGKKTGRWKIYDKKTLYLKSISYYENDLLHGIDSVFLESPDDGYSYLSQIHNYNNGKKHGKQYDICHDPQNNFKEYYCRIQFYENGLQLDSIVTLDSKGKIISNE